MVTTIEIPNEYGYVILTAAASFVLSVWHGGRVIRYRRKASIPLPHAYATPEQMSAVEGYKKQAMYLFNCAQRAHGNYMETHLNMLVSMLIAGVQYPKASAALGMGWLMGRVLYAVGYVSTSKPEGKARIWGTQHWACQLALIGMAGKVGFDLLR